MATMFEQLMKGLDEVEAYLEGEREGYKVHVPDASDEATATIKAAAEAKYRGSSLRSE